MEEIDPQKTAIVWYDFSCPYSYVGRHRTAILIQHGIPVVELPFQMQRDVPAEGLRIRSRQGAAFPMLSRAAKEAGLTLKWSIHVPNTRGALACAEWVRVHLPETFASFQQSLFEAHFVAGENLSDPQVVGRRAVECGIDMSRVKAALADGSAGAGLRDAERVAARFGVRATPAWLIGQQMITNLLPAEEFERIAHQGMGTNLTA